MGQSSQYPKRLIEVDLPIARISAHARREKSIRHGHISTLHIWWARRPLAACRAVICAALWPDPADPLCPQAFREAAVEQIHQFANRVFPKKITAEGRLLSSEKHCSPESRARWEAIAAGTLTLDANEPADLPMLRMCLLDFIADFANWDNSTVPAYLETSRALTHAAHESLGGEPGTRPLVVDPFAGGGAIPLEALRVGADAFASDLNPVAVLLCKVVLEYIPKYGRRLADEVRKWGRWIKEQAEKELAEFYPKDPDGATPIAYLWARTIRCEGPNCGAEVPLMRSLWLSKKKTNAHALRLKNTFSPPLSRTGVSPVDRAVSPVDRAVSPVARAVPAVSRAADRRDACPTEPKLQKTRRKLPHWKLDGSVYFVTFSTSNKRELSPQARDIVFSACKHWHGKRAWFYGIVVMPDHVHLLFQLYPGEDLSKLLHSIKSFSAHQISTTGVPPVDKSVPPVDKSVPPVDKSVPPVDKSVPPVDKSVPPVDKSVPPVEDASSVKERQTGQTPTAKHPNSSNRRDGPSNRRDGCSTVWLAESMDRIVRNEFEFAQKLNYLYENPLRKGLVDDPDEWPWLFVTGEEEWPTGGTPVVLFEIVENPKAKDVANGTVARGSATCPCCGYTTPVTSVRAQLKKRHGGAADARLFCVVTTRPDQLGRFYRLPNDRDLAAARAAAEELVRCERQHEGPMSLVPDEPLPPIGVLGFRVQRYGMKQWGDLFTPRQALALTTLVRLVREVADHLRNSTTAVPAVGSRTVAQGTNTQDAGPDRRDACPTGGLAEAVATCLALVLGRQANACASLARVDITRDTTQGVFARQAIGMVWDFAEVNPLCGSSGDWDGALAWVLSVCQSNAPLTGTSGHADQASATAHPLPDDAAAAFVTDPPYYDAVPYAYLSDFFYVWLRRTLAHVHAGLLRRAAVPKDAEIVVDRPHHLSQSTKDVAFYERELTRAFADGRRVLRPDGVAVIVFASKTTASWEAILEAVIKAGWTVTGSWPIDTEMGTRVAAQGQARLASSVHIACRPRWADRRDACPTARTTAAPADDNTGEWRDVLSELPKRIHEWMPRLAEEGIVGADAIFACLGPALEIFSRYSRVEKASGEEATLREYLEHVWAAVSTEALSMIFKDADAGGLEPDARLTAMWLWTLSKDEGGRRKDEGGRMKDEG